MSVSSRCLVTLLAVCLLATAGMTQELLLQIQGQPYSDGDITFHLLANEGEPAFLLWGLDLLPSPVVTGKGAFYMGTILVVLPLGPIPAGGQLDIPLTLPTLDPAVAGIPLVLQGYTPGALSNPATLPLDQPYYTPEATLELTSPTPEVGGRFGDKIATGDLNDDGSTDIAVGAWWEDAKGVLRGGRVHVFWGPDLTSSTTLEPVAPVVNAEFGLALEIGDVTGDAVDDLLVGENTGSLPPPNTPAPIHVFAGGSAFATTPQTDIMSVITGDASYLYGRRMTLGDFNGDGVDDIAIAAPSAEVQGFSNAGQIEVHWGPDFGTVQILIAPDVAADAYFADSLASGDLTGDGTDDLLLGASRKTLGGVPSLGRVYVFAGGSQLDYFLTLDHPDPDGLNSRFGQAVAASDLDGDGIDEIVATDERNHAYLFWSPDFASFTRVTRPPDAVTGMEPSVSFGYAVGVADVNGDQELDVLVGEPFANELTGRIFAALGPTFATFHVITDAVPEQGGVFGLRLRVRDLDGDGRVELIAGSDLADPGGVSGSGRVTVFDLD